MNLHLYNTMVKDPVSGEMVPLAVLGGGSDEAIQAWLDDHPEALSQAVLTDYDVLKTEVDTIIANDTKYLTGYEIRVYEGDTAADDNTYEEIISSEAVVLQVAYQNYNSATGTEIKTDNITYTLSSGPLSTQQTIDLVITDSSDTRFTVYIICAIPSSSEEPSIPELADIRIGADGTTYSSAGNAVRGQVGDLKSVVNENFELLNDAIEGTFTNTSTNIIDNRLLIGDTPENALGLTGTTYEAYIPLKFGDNAPSGRAYKGYFVLNDGTADQTNLNAIQLVLADENKNAFGTPITQGTFNNSSFNVSVPSNAKYLKLIMYNWRSYTIVKFGLCVSEYTDYTEIIDSERLDNIETEIETIQSNLQNKWNGKKWVAYGDSITAQNRWQPYVVSAIGLELVNAGLGGSSVADGNDQSIASFTDSSRISALPSDADAVTIMGGTNDFNGTNSATGSPIGELPSQMPFDTSTFIGALCETVRLIQEQCPNALIVLMSNVGGRGSTGVVGTVPLKNAKGLSSADYADATRAVADYLGLPFVNVHGCGINPYNRTKYIADSVHPNDAGGELISRPVISFFESHKPN